MFITFSSCEFCGRMIEGRDCLPVVEAVCTTCGTRARVCPACKRRGCPICGGSLKSSWIIMAEKAPVGQSLKSAKGRRR